MKGAVRHEYGSPENVLNVEEVDTPTPADDEVLVRVHAASVNLGSWEILTADPPKVGIRGSCPIDIWHVDTTLIRLLDETRAYVHAVIDDFSRRILAWKTSATFDPSTTAELLLSAASGLVDEKPTLLVDGGVENYNSAVDELVDSGLLQRLLAMLRTIPGTAGGLHNKSWDGGALGNKGRETRPRPRATSPENCL